MHSWHLVRTVLLLPLVLVPVACRHTRSSGAPGAGPGVTGGYTVDQHLTTPDGRERTYHLHIPAELPAGPVPLLIALHGGVGSGSQFEQNSGFDAIAEREGMLVVYPDGVGVGPREDRARTWNAGYCCGSAARDSVDDVMFIRMVIDAIGRDHEIDPARVFAAGHSNGGMMAYRLACELSDRVVAVGLQAGSLGIDECRPSVSVSLLHLHGTADTNHPIDGGRGTTGISGIDFRSARTSASTYAAAVGCPGTPAVVADPTNADLEVTTWGPCADGTEVRFVAVAGASHAWMGHATQAPRLVGEPYLGVDASEEVVRFVLAHPRVNVAPGGVSERSSADRWPGTSAVSTRVTRR